jgi:hypothetical protein
MKTAAGVISESGSPESAVARRERCGGRASGGAPCLGPLRAAHPVARPYARRAQRACPNRPRHPDPPRHGAPSPPRYNPTAPPAPTRTPSRSPHTRHDARTPHLLAPCHPPHAPPPARHTHPARPSTRLARRPPPPPGTGARPSALRPSTEGELAAANRRTAQTEPALRTQADARSLAARNDLTPLIRRRLAALKYRQLASAGRAPGGRRCASPGGRRCWAWHGGKLCLGGSGAEANVAAAVRPGRPPRARRPAHTAVRRRPASRSLTAGGVPQPGQRLARMPRPCSAICRSSRQRRAPIHQPSRRPPRPRSRPNRPRPRWRPVVGCTSHGRATGGW